jgi:MFS family permease
VVLVNAFVGAMVGLERSILPALAEEEFNLAAHSAIELSFIAVFGLTKALTNYQAAGRWSDRFGRKPVLLAGWLIAAPVPLLLMWAPSWSWVIVANVLLGASQGLTWSTTVIMKIDLVGPAQRGLAMGLNEFAGYFAVAASALATGWLAQTYGLRPEPFYLGVVYVLAGGSNLGVRGPGDASSRGPGIMRSRTSSPKRTQCRRNFPARHLEGSQSFQRQSGRLRQQSE